MNVVLWMLVYQINIFKLFNCLPTIVYSKVRLPFKQYNAPYKWYLYLPHFPIN